MIKDIKIVVDSYANAIAHFDLTAGGTQLSAKDADK